MDIFPINLFENVNIDKDIWRYAECRIITIFFDESGVNLSMTRLYGREKIGERVVTNAPWKLRSQNKCLRSIKSRWFNYINDGNW
jgi:hypothetical protein